MSFGYLVSAGVAICNARWCVFALHRELSSFYAAARA
jgi:hypothetical protein